MSLGIDLAGRVFLVCGVARGGIGGATARRIAAAGEYGIRANTVSPGAVLTERVKSRVPPANVESNDDVKFTSVDQLANAIVFLLSDLASGISGQTLVVDSALSTKFCGGGRKTATAC
jgi:3-oxoacyl-[acyl-carrier protein] reductase